MLLFCFVLTPCNKLLRTSVAHVECCAGIRRVGLFRYTLRLLLAPVVNRVLARRSFEGNDFLFKKR